MKFDAHKQKPFHHLHLHRLTSLSCDGTRHVAASGHRLDGVVFITLSLYYVLWARASFFSYKSVHNYSSSFRSSSICTDVFYIHSWKIFLRIIELSLDILLNPTFWVNISGSHNWPDLVCSLEFLSSDGRENFLAWPSKILRHGKFMYRFPRFSRIDFPHHSKPFQSKSRHKSLENQFKFSKPEISH